MNNLPEVNNPSLTQLLEGQLNSVSLNRVRPYASLCQKILDSSASDAEINALCVCIYTALQHRSSIFFSLIQEIEISVRNEVSLKLKEYASSNNLELKDYFCNLLFDSDSKLTTESKGQLRKSITELVGKSNINKKKNALEALNRQNKGCNEIIAELTFGFWVHFFNPNNGSNSTYWSNVLHKDAIFNGSFRTSKEIFTTLTEVLRFRNKLFHQDAIWKGKSTTSPGKALDNLKRKYDRFTECLKRISPEREAIRKKGTLQEAFYEFNFDEDLFYGELSNLYINHFGLEFKPPELI